MERRFFKLPSGYLNVDERAITFTRSGNWGEVEGAQERGGPVSGGHTIRVVIGVAILCVGMVFAGLKSAHGDGSLAFVLALAGGAYGLYVLMARLRHDFARTFRIPFSKVRSMHWEEGRLVIHFVNARMKEDRVSVEVEEEAGAWIMEMWQASRLR